MDTLISKKKVILVKITSNYYITVTLLNIASQIILNIKFNLLISSFNSKIQISCSQQFL